jgi:hypothetical protein
MCWNKDVSLNTFLFSFFVMILIIYNNAYTPYKLPDFYNIGLIVFMFSFIFMQLIEYFIWININNKWYNHFFTLLALLLVLFQPIASNMIITNYYIRNIMIALYLLLMIPFATIQFTKKNIYSNISKMGHLQWNMILGDGNSLIDKMYTFLWLFFFLSPFLIQRTFFSFLFGLSTFFVISYFYLKDKTVGSMWCWIVNICMIYYAIVLLLLLPFSMKPTV